MIKNGLKEKHSSEDVEKTALKHYKKYVAHYISKNLNPMPFNEFFKNYKV